jgi:hypothetical protein
MFWRQKSFRAFNQNPADSEPCQVASPPGVPRSAELLRAAEAPGGLRRGILATVAHKGGEWGYLRLVTRRDELNKTKQNARRPSKSRNRHRK